MGQIVYRKPKVHQWRAFSDAVAGSRRHDMEGMVLLDVRPIMERYVRLTFVDKVRSGGQSGGCWSAFAYMHTHTRTQTDADGQVLSRWVLGAEDEALVALSALTEVDELPSSHSVHAIHAVQVQNECRWCGGAPLT